MRFSSAAIPGLALVCGVGVCAGTAVGCQRTLPEPAPGVSASVASRAGRTRVAACARSQPPSLCHPLPRPAGMRATCCVFATPAHP